ncbi:DinB family protein [Saccharibacillus alkalitolerans]|uniref:DinB family protein n=1 Tax=Saccharibacillus alkalitolerans TaxID=2705290 RepID=A0ABX0F7N3_9BACL|nr:DinB family protein [Saccharibacillus alkalitolerans]NGZ76318.1 DinB family protein [Saccharibacillus alkalitolerans]
MNTPYPANADSRGASAQDGPVLQSLKASALRYRELAAKLSLEELRRHPSDDEWSLGQMLMHLVGSALHMQLANAKRCLETSAADEVFEGKTETGEAVFRTGSFPPVRIKVPASPQYTPAQPESKEEIFAGLERVVAAAEELEPLVAERSGQRTAPHPSFGGLNAAEWLKLTEMHYRHHFLQEERLLDWLHADRRTAPMPPS